MFSSRKLTYPTLGKGKSSWKVPFTKGYVRNPGGSFSPIMKAPLLLLQRKHPHQVPTNVPSPQSQALRWRLPKDRTPTLRGGCKGSLKREIQQWKLGLSNFHHTILEDDDDDDDDDDYFWVASKEVMQSISCAKCSTWELHRLRFDQNAEQSLSWRNVHHEHTAAAWESNASEQRPCDLLQSKYGWKLALHLALQQWTPCP